MEVGKRLQFFGARVNLAKMLLYAINGGRDEITGRLVVSGHEPVSGGVLEPGLDARAAAGCDRPHVPRAAVNVALLAARLPRGRRVQACSVAPARSIGWLHSWDLSVGVSTGPGTRLVAFLAGCPMRCPYCRNQDTWERRRGEPARLDAIERLMYRYRTFMSAAGGGFTVSGGEPLQQARFARAAGGILHGSAAVAGATTARSGFALRTLCPYTPRVSR